MVHDTVVNADDEEWAERMAKREAAVALIMKLAESGKPPPPSLRPSRQLWPIGDDGNRIPLPPGLVVTVGGAWQEPPGLPLPELPRPPDHTDRGVSKRRWGNQMMQWRDALRAFLW